MKNRTLRVAIGNTLSEEKTNRKRSRPGSGIEYHAIFSGNGGNNTQNRRTH
jgi:hypothetical protein